MAALTVSPKRQHLGLYIRFQPCNFQAIDVADFLRALLRHLRGPIVLLWDRGSIHRGPAIDAVCQAHPRLHLEAFPAYAPELNPVEYIWGYWKHHELPNFCPRDFGQLSYQARRALRRMRRRPPLVRSFWRQANLSL